MLGALVGSVWSGLPEPLTAEFSGQAGGGWDDAGPSQFWFWPLDSQAPTWSAAAVCWADGINSKGNLSFHAGSLGPS